MSTTNELNTQNNASKAKLEELELAESSSEYGGKGEIQPAQAPRLTTLKEEDADGYKEYIEGQNIEFTPQEMRKVRWKIDALVMPMFLVTQGLQFMDRTALNYANLFGYQRALNLKGTQFNYLSAMVYAGYFFGQYPAGYLIARFKAQRVLGIAVMIWGLLVLLMTQCHNYSSAMFVRFAMGFFEAAATPALTLMTPMWYTRREVPLRQCIWYSSLGWGGIVGSYMSTGISKLPADVNPAKWQLVFYILGGATMLWSFIIYFFMPDSPSNAYHLTHRERLIAVKRVASNEIGVKNKHFNKQQALLSFYDPKVILLWICVFAAAVPTESSTRSPPSSFEIWASLPLEPPSSRVSEMRYKSSLSSLVVQSCSTCPTRDWLLQRLPIPCVLSLPLSPHSSRDQTLGAVSCPSGWSMLKVSASTSRL